MMTFSGWAPQIADRSRWTLPETLATRTRTHAGKRFLSVPDEAFSVTYDEMHAQATRIGGALLSEGGKPGDRVIIMGANSSAFIQTWFGCAYAGMVEVPINTAYIGDFLEHQVAMTAPVFAVIDAGFAERFATCVAARATIKCFYIRSGDAGDRAEASSLLRRAGFAVAPFEGLLEGPIVELPAVTPRDLESILFTSGTTGPSKGVMMPHGHMHLVSEQVAAMARLTESDVYMVDAPLFHGNAQFVSTYPALISGAEVVLHQRFSASRWLERIRAGNVTVTNFTSVMMDFVWKQPPSERDLDNVLRCVVAIPTARSIEEEFKRRFGIDAFVEGYGLTETGSQVMTPYGMDRPVGAAGLLVDDWFEVRLADPETGEEVPVGAVGEMLVRPKCPATFSLGYFGMPEATAHAFRDLWFHSGDALRRDEEGWYYFVDRIKDALRRRGENISSYEIERPIVEHPDVLECAVVGVPAEIDAGEDEVLAVVVAREGADLCAEDVWSWCEQRVPAFAVPRYVRLVAALPKTPLEKIRKSVLREEGITAGTEDRLLAASARDGNGARDASHTR
jgi:carnitine-CoA ligase